MSMLKLAVDLYRDLGNEYPFPVNKNADEENMKISMLENELEKIYKEEGWGGIFHFYKEIIDTGIGICNCKKVERT